MANRLIQKEEKIKMDYEDLRPEDIEDEDIKIEIDKDAFKGPLICTKCNRKMNKVITDFDLPGGEITLHLEVYRCEKCNREYLSGDQAEKFDNMLILIDAIRHRSKFKFERAANYDGKNWFIRFPRDITKNWDKNKITDIIPITNQDFFIHVKNKKE